MKQRQINKIEWKEIALGDGDYFEIIGSGIDKFTGEKEYLSTESIKGAKIEKIECKIKYNDKPSRANMQPLMNSVWFAKMQATLKVYAFTKENEEEINQYILSTGFAGIKLLNKNISPEYVRIYFTTDKFNLEKDKLCTGSTQRGINNSFIIKIKIPLPFSNNQPDLKEQERIVKILENAENLKEKSNKAEELLDEFLKSVFNELFLEGDFKKDSLKEHTSLISSGSTPLGGSKNYLDRGDILFIRSQNVLMNKFSNYDKLFISKEIHDKMKRTWVKKRDVLLNITGASIGRTAIYLGEDNKANVNQHVCIIRLNKELDSYFVNYYLSSKTTQEYISRINAGGTREALNFKQIGDIKIPLPPLPLQQKFAKIVEQIEMMKENVKKTKQNSEELFNSLMQKAFRGEL